MPIRLVTGPADYATHLHRWEAFTTARTLTAFVAFALIITIAVRATRTDREPALPAAAWQVSGRGSR